MTIRNSAPCKGCKERYSGCHSMCLYYQNWKEEHEAKKESLYGQRQKESMVTEFTVDSIFKMKRGRGKRGKKRVV